MPDVGRVLVLGSSGQLGHDLARRLAESGARAPETPGRAAVELSRPDAVESSLAGFEFDVLVNCAGYTAVDAAESSPAAAFAVNAYAVESLARSCRERGARLVQVSTDYVFDGRSSRPYREDDPPAPLGVYGASKLAGEALARRAWGEGTVVVRTASLFGTGPASAAGRAAAGAPRARNFVETVLRKAAAGERLRVVDDVTMSPTSSAELASALVALLSASPEPGVYHLAGAGEATWHGFAVAALELAGVAAEVEPIPSSAYPTPARRPAYSVLDTGRARALGIELRPWREGLADYLKSRA